MRLIALLSVLLVASAGIPAQQPGVNPAVMAAPPASEGCPVQLFAQRRAAGSIEVADNGAKKRGQGLEILFDRSSVAIPRIAKASLIVHGYSTQPRAIPAAVQSSGALSESFEVKPEARVARLQQSSLWTATMNTVSWLELTHIEYADGSSWHESPSSHCRAAPNGFVLVDAR